MTILEIERKTGLVRANIRFYEEQGLIKPDREPNGYRDYSDEDLAVLQKIKLLRQLHLSVDTIKQLQDKRLKLCDAVLSKQREMEQKQMELVRAQAICKTLLEDHAEYETLNPDKYEGQTIVTDEGYLAKDRLQTAPYPWRRYFARMVDSLLYGIIWVALSMLVFRMRIDTSLWGTMFNGFVGALIMLVIEPMLLSTFGTTLGKRMFGLQVKTTDGQKLSYSHAASRTFGVIRYGFGFMIPIYNILRLVKCFNLCKKDEVLPWDEEISYTIKDTKAFRGVLCAVAYALSFALIFLISLQAELPVHRGNITPAQYAQNVNDAARRAGIFQGYYMDESGIWQTDTQSMSFVMDDILINHHIETDEYGYVAKVSFRLKSVGNPEGMLFTFDESKNMALEMTERGELQNVWPSPLYLHKYLAVAAFFGAQENVNAFNYQSCGVLTQIQDGYINYSAEYFGMKMSNDVTYQGYELFGKDALFPVEAQSHSFEIAFAMERGDAIREDD